MTGTYPHSIADALRTMSIQDFRILGSSQFSYIKPVFTTDHKTTFALHAADGKLLTTQGSPQIAMLVARQNGLEPLTVH